MVQVQVTEALDEEWVALIKEALLLGIKKEEILEFFSNENH